jgi:Leucine-rich repeat (LRR) protein
MKRKKIFIGLSLSIIFIILAVLIVFIIKNYQLERQQKNPTQPTKDLLNNIKPNTGNKNDNLYFSEDGAVLRIKEQNLVGNADLTNSKFFNLRILNLQSNKITSVDISNLPNLETLNLNNNKITEIDISKNDKLKFLYLSDNQITSITGIEKLSKLIRLYLQNNKLTYINGIKSLINLKEF